MKKVEKKTNQEELVTKSYLDARLKEFKTEIRDEMRMQTGEILQGVDKILVRFDAAEKDHAAHAALHGRITDDLHVHDVRIKKLEARAA